MSPAIGEVAEKLLGTMFRESSLTCYDMGHWFLRPHPKNPVTFISKFLVLEKKPDHYLFSSLGNTRSGFEPMTFLIRS